jgi:DNA-binding NarL/FixJ family response regulator
MMAEYVAYRALSYACLGDAERSGALAADARRLHGSSVETLALASCSEAISAVVTKREKAADLVRVAFGVVRSTGGYDSLVVAGRACPGLLALMAERKDSAAVLNSLLSRSNDFDLGRQVGIDVTGDPVGPLSELTKREVEVAQLIGYGLTNRDIAQRLFISESTVKAHVRHILRKLNASKRAEVAARVALK